MELEQNDGAYSCEIRLRENPQRRKDKVVIGCGAGFGGDRSFAAVKLLQRVEGLDYLVLECLAERTLADRYQVMASGGDGFDSRISEWMSLLLPLAVEKGTCIITNMGAMDPLGAQKNVINIATNLGLHVTVAVAYEVALTKSGSGSLVTSEGGASTYLGAAPIVQCLEKYEPHVIITSRVADAALFLGPMVYELGWNWNDLQLLAQGSLAGHLLECGCQLTGGYFMHPGDKYRDLSFELLFDLSLPFAEVGFDGSVCVAKAEGSGGVISFSTCAQQLIYEVGDPAAYITPDVDYGWKGWGEISYGGYGCIKRAKAAEFLVRSWMEEVLPGVNERIVSYIIGLDSLKATNISEATLLERDSEDIRLRMDGLFEQKEHAVQFVKEFTALYTNGPAGGGGISTGHKKEIILEKELVGRESVLWKTGAEVTEVMDSSLETSPKNDRVKDHSLHGTHLEASKEKTAFGAHMELPSLKVEVVPAPAGQRIPLYHVAHGRAGDKGNDLNFSLIPHFPSDIERLKTVITPEWVKQVVLSLLGMSSSCDPDAIKKRNCWVNEHVKVEIYEVKGIQSLNVMVRNILDGGVNCSRRIDRHGKTISDLILCQQVVLPL
ncbi:uncharacterized protein LOC122663151 isoform X2 [Telopea speciosissima]|uniref:uncharacterized protein LOC122663151 isoform X2 n=1 Tax=Telopea speciosissima TaxID=54955 RepID=UPI001CC49EF3|nr:uncharacterized protein LOC122663151 isoform X2 [Telopea speciosissima]